MQRLESSLRHRLTNTVLFGLVALGALLVARILAFGGTLQLLAAFGLVAAVVIAYRPIIGLYACFPLLLMVQYGTLRVSFPILHSPLQIVAMLTLGAAVARRFVEDRRLPRSPIYLPVIVLLLVLMLFAIAGHGPAASERFSRFLEDLWPLALIPLLVRTPREARNVLLALVASVIALSVLWLPGLIALAGAGGDAARLAAAGQISEPSLAVSFIGLTGTLSYLTLLAMAYVSPILLGAAMGGRRWRVVSLLGYAALATAIMASSYAIALIALAVGTVAAVGLHVLAPGERPGRRGWGAATAAVAAAPLAFLGIGLPVAQHSVARILHPQQDISGSTRLYALGQGFHAFLASPLTGWGAYDAFTVSRSGWALGGHSSFVTMAYEFGLALLVPFAWLLYRITKEYVRFLKLARTPQERALGVGILASLATQVLTAFIDPVYGDVMQDAVIWTLAGLVVVWNAWRVADPQTVVAG